MLTYCTLTAIHSLYGNSHNRGEVQRHCKVLNWKQRVAPVGGCSLITASSNVASLSLLECPRFFFCSRQLESRKQQRHLFLHDVISQCTHPPVNLNEWGILVCFILKLIVDHREERSQLGTEDIVALWRHYPICCCLTRYDASKVYPRNSR